MNISEKAKLLSEEVVKIQEEDLLQIMNELGMTINDALKKLQVIHHKQNEHGVEYSIMDIDTLEVYKHRKIDFGLFGTYRLFK